MEVDELIFQEPVKELHQYLHQVELSNETIEQVAEHCKKSVINLAGQWKRLDPETPEEINEFYTNNLEYLYDLTYYECVKGTEMLREFESFSPFSTTVELSSNPSQLPPIKSIGTGMRSIMERDIAFSHVSNNILDFGAGISLIGSMEVASYQIDYVDINKHAREFLNWRLIKHLDAFDSKKNHRVLDSLPQGVYGRKPYTFVYSSDVFEHLPNPEKTIQEIISCCKPDAKFFIYVGGYYNDTLYPQHLNNNINEIMEKYFFKMPGYKYYYRIRKENIKE